MRYALLTYLFVTSKVVYQVKVEHKASILISMLFLVDAIIFVKIPGSATTCRNCVSCSGLLGWSTSPGRYWQVSATTSYF